MMPQTTQIQPISPCYTSPPPPTTSFAQQPYNKAPHFIWHSITHISPWHQLLLLISMSCTQIIGIECMMCMEIHVATRIQQILPHLPQDPKALQFHHCLWIHHLKTHHCQKTNEFKTLNYSLLFHSCFYVQ